MNFIITTGKFCLYTILDQVVCINPGHVGELVYPHLCILTAVLECPEHSRFEYTHSFLEPVPKPSGLLEGSLIRLPLFNPLLFHSSVHLSESSKPLF